MFNYSKLKIFAREGEEEAGEERGSGGACGVRMRSWGDEGERRWWWSSSEQNPPSNAGNGPIIEEF